MSIEIATVVVADEQDVVCARQRARLIAELVGFDRTDQTKLSTAVSEIARNAFQYAGGGTVTFELSGEAPQVLAVTVRDQGDGMSDLISVLGGRYASTTGMGLGLVGTRRLMDHFLVETAPGAGTTVSFGKNLPADAGPVTEEGLVRVADALLASRGESPLAEVRLQNEELMRTLDELRDRQDELLRLNTELEDTNRGVLALYAELDDKATELSRANQLKARFLSGLGHEFRTPLNSIMALADLLVERTDGDLTSEQERQVEYIRQGADSLSALVNDLLDLAKIEAGKTVVHPQPFSLADLLGALRGMIKPLAVNEQVELVIEEPDPALPHLVSDDAKIAQILRNFLSNALKFTERGEIRLRVTAADDGASAVFSVSDTGVGIDPADQQRIFEEYAQVEGKRHAQPGTGLGLPISRHLAELLGGRVELQSEPGKGSVFTAVIPWRYTGPAAGAAKPRPAAGAAKPRPAAGDAPADVLVVEDDEATTLVYTQYFRDSGYRLLTASTLEEARTVLRQTRPVAILLDLLIGEGDSWWFLADVKSDPATRDIPVIITSVLEEQAKGLALGADDYCVKPVDRSWLLGMLQSLGARRPVETMLIIDDEQVARYILKGHLAGSSYRVLEASDGEEGLDIAVRRQPDVIFLDLMMPRMNGFEVLHRLKELPETRDIPVIISTARSLDEEEREELNGSAVAILPKRAPSRAAALDAVGDALRRALSGCGTQS